MLYHSHHFYVCTSFVSLSLSSVCVYLPHWYIVFFIIDTSLRPVVWIKCVNKTLNTPVFHPCGYYGSRGEPVTSPSFCMEPSSGPTRLRWRRLWRHVSGIKAEGGSEDCAHRLKQHQPRGKPPHRLTDSPSPCRSPYDGDSSHISIN